jgi:hypothetical protein
MRVEKNVCHLKKTYKDLCRKKKYIFKQKKMNDIGNLIHAKPKVFWNYFKRKSKSTHDISIEEFSSYFATIGSDVTRDKNPDAEIFCTIHDFNNMDCRFEELDKTITVQEFYSVVKELKRVKSSW